jgi:predicted dehydrogenase
MLRLGIIGCGRVTTMFHLRALEGLEEVRLVAVADSSEKRMTEVRRACGAESGCLDYHDLLRSPNVDAVSVNTPPRLHEQMTLEALEAGKHVLCEKPLAQTVEGCLRVKDLREMKGLVVLPGHNYAYSPSLIKIEEEVRRGSIGDLVRVEVHFENNLKGYGAQTSFRTENNRGIVEDIMPHILSVTTGVAGRVAEVEEVSWWCKSFDVCDNMEVRLRTEHGVGLDCSLSWTRMIPTFRLDLYGSKGSLHTDLAINPFSYTLETNEMRRKFKSRGLDWYLDLVRFKHPSFREQYRHLAKLVDGTETPRITIDDEITILETMERVSAQLPETGKNPGRQVR